MKDEHGEEIKQAPGIFEEAIALAKAKVDLLEKAGITDKTLVNNARNTTIRDFYINVLKTVIEPRFADNANDDAEDGADDDLPATQPVTGGFADAEDEIPF